MKNIFVFLIVIANNLSLNAQQLITYDHYYKLKIKEPSGLCLSADEETLFIVSDSKGVYQTDLKGEIKNAYLTSDYDFEGVCLVTDTSIVAIDEGSNNLVFFSLNPLILKETIALKIKSNHNNGIEAICRDDNLNWLVFQEKNPVKLFVLNKKFEIINSQRINRIKDISGACHYKGNTYVLSDEEASIYRLSKDFSSAEKIFSLPFSSAEGIAINSQGDLLIVSDSSETLYIFKGMIK